MLTQYLLTSMLIASAISYTDVQASTSCCYQKGSLKAVFLTLLVCTVKSTEKDACHNPTNLDHLDGLASQQTIMPLVSEVIGDFPSDPMASQSSEDLRETHPFAIPEKMKQVCGISLDGKSDACIYVPIEKNTFWYYATLSLSLSLMTFCTYHKCFMNIRNGKIVSLNRRIERLRRERKVQKIRSHHLEKTIEIQERKWHIHWQKHFNDEHKNTWLSEVQKGHQHAKAFYHENAVDIDWENERGCTGVMMGVLNKDIKLVSLLVELGANGNKGDHGGLRPIIEATKHKNLSLIKVLRKTNVDVTCQDVFSHTAYHYAEKNGYVDIATYLKMWKESVSK